MLDIILGNTDFLHQSLGCLVAFRMNACRIQCFASAMDTQETGTLLVCLWSKLRHLQKLLTVLEAAICLAV